MWWIAALLLISFALILFSRIAKTSDTRWIVGGWGIAIGASAIIFVQGDRSSIYTIMGLLLLFPTASKLIGIPVWKRRVISPRFGPKRAGRRTLIGLSFLFGCLACVSFFALTGEMASFGIIFFRGAFAATVLMQLALNLFERIEICANGIWHDWRLQLWEEFGSYSWDGAKKDGVVLTVASKSSVGAYTRLVVPREDCEAVQALLEAHLPNLGTLTMNS